MITWDAEGVQSVHVRFPEPGSYSSLGSYGHFRFDLDKDTGTYELETSLNGDEVYLSKKVNNRLYHLANYQLE